MKPKHKQSTAGLAILALSFSFFAAPLSSSAQVPSMPMFAMPSQPQFNNFWKPDFQKPFFHARVCAQALAGFGLAGCDAHVITDAGGKAKTFTAPSGYGPAQFQAAYGITAASGHPIIAIVDAYNAPNITSDLNTYNKQFGLPSFPACAKNVSGSAVPCFQKVNQNGGSFLPLSNSGWALEISLDVEVAHGACPQCSILLVETNSSSYNDLLTGIDRAAIMGAKVISDSWGGGEFSGETSYDSHLNKPGVAITFSSGDSGYGVEYPASSRYVTAVGGTSLMMNGLAYAGETAWSGAGSGCSQFESKPVWQTDAGCVKRTIADVSADADPNTGAAVYDSYHFSGRAGWFQVGGTSLASPLVAAAYATGTPIPAGTAPNQMPYINSSLLHDVTGGGNGTCGGEYLCTAISGYDGPTGLGSPNGGGAF
ncbi:MAG: S53 family peptidase [Candidatus Doudnabacteria bacterium]|nr:S53 family peptidase [Candidatus Doudnabacteria bacterium]